MSTPEVSPGKMSDTFAQPNPIRPGACPICGALPACASPKPKGDKR
jgi:hypothetical protein